MGRRPFRVFGATLLPALASPQLRLPPINLGAITMVHWRFGFFMNWFGAQPGEGIEYHLLVLGLALGLVMSGGGAWSLDRRLSLERAR